MSKYDCECTHCGAPLNPHLGIGMITCIAHQPFCDKECYQKWCEAQIVSDDLDETETGGDYDVKDNL